MASGSGIADLVRNATVIVSAGPAAETAEALGSGFFVAPGWVLTCAHVVRQRRDLWIEWHGQSAPAALEAMQPDPANNASVPFPDTAVLRVNGIERHPCVPLAEDDPAEDAPLYVYGVTRVRTGIVEPDSSLLTYAGRVGQAPNELYKLTNGTIAAGQSGGPVLDLSTYRVCGMVKSSLDEVTQAGGHAIPIASALDVAGSSDLLEQNREIHGDSVAALRNEQASLDPLPQMVAALLSTQAAGTLALQLELKPELRSLVATEEFVEWVARHLFRLQLIDLVRVLNEAQPVLGASTGQILWMVGCCLPADNERPTSWWVPSEAALALRTEWAAERPRVVALGSDEFRTRQFLARRALCGDAAEIGMLPFTASADAITGMPSQLGNDIRVSLGRLLNISPADWDRRRAVVTRMQRTVRRFIVLDPAALGDRGFLTALLDEFGGLFFLIGSRLPVGNDFDDVLLSLKPSIEPGIEENAIYALGLLESASP